MEFGNKLPIVREIKDTMNARSELKLRGTDLDNMSPAEAARIEELRQTVRANVNALVKIAGVLATISAIIAYLVLKPQQITHSDTESPRPKPAAGAQAPDPAFGDLLHAIENYHASTANVWGKTRVLLELWGFSPAEIERQRHAVLDNSGTKTPSPIGPIDFETNFSAISNVQTEWLIMINKADPTRKPLANFFIQHAKLALYEVRQDKDGKTKVSRGAPLPHKHDFLYSDVEEMTMDPVLKWVQVNRMPFYHRESRTLYLPRALKDEQLGKYGGLQTYLWPALNDAYSHITTGEIKMPDETYMQTAPEAIMWAGIFRDKLADLLKAVDPSVLPSLIVSAQKLIEIIGKSIDESIDNNPWLKQPHEKERTTYLIVRAALAKPGADEHMQRYVIPALREIADHPDLIVFPSDK